MPAPTGYPALYLYPLNDSFVPKHISLLHNQRVKIGRQTNAKTTPGERNGYFDSKVLSRQHAEVWEEGGKIFIKDVKSSNGTFINGERLSPEGLESDPYELKSDDIVEFGIDIVGEDNKTIIHHKVAARVLCILSDHDLQMAARAEQHQQIQHGNIQQQQQQHQQQTLNGPPSSFNFSAAAAASQQPPPRRPQISQQAMAGMGGMGGSMRPPGKGGLTFDHIITRLQGELQKSRETGAELHTLTGAMTEIHDTLGAGNLPPNPPPNPHTLPPARQRNPSEPVSAPVPDPASSSPPESHIAPSSHIATAPSSASPPPPPTLIDDLQSQLKETQASLAAHVDRIRAMEGALKEQETMKREVTMLREMMDVLQRREAPPPQPSQPPQAPQSSEEFEDSDDDGDDSRSIATITPHELERVDEEDEDAEEEQVEEDEESGHGSGSRHHVDELDMDELTRGQDREHEESDEERRIRREELGRPRTPEPTNLGMKINGLHHPSGETTRNRSKTLTGRSSAHPNQNHSAIIEELSAKLTSFAAQLESALELSKGLQKDHRDAQEIIRSLEQKVEGLEGVVKKQQEKEAEAAAAATVEQVVETAKAVEEDGPSSLTSMILEWKSNVEGQWSSVREEWSEERSRLVKAREEWESKMRGEWEKKVREVDDGLERIGKLEKEVATDRENREKEKELAVMQVHSAAMRQPNITPLTENGDAVKYRGVGLMTPPSPRSVSSDYEYTSSRPGRKRSRSASGIRSRGKAGRRRRSTSRGEDTDDTEETLAVDDHGNSIFGKDTPATKDAFRSQNLTTSSESSLFSGRPDMSSDKSVLSENHQGLNAVGTHAKNNAHMGTLPNSINVQTAMGVLVLSVAAAAVVWRVKPE
ncbi:cell cycle arrest in response to pheromone-related protein [Moniliophthora roreri MCA 2997]|uniref:Cell cycle arrest in response to pheromone-related protein n=2 Tax=Moniliophthora roreri TaxID=221103 RepID=V2X1T4_MONRO|nr:cell cycle arrest in response to pheromone-related protein [Moniliophthora roreri MCA 2997]KAI3619890.1 cell cycle arrest in response to pheromone-related protein [Moniliophthora roreri]